MNNPLETHTVTDQITTAVQFINSTSSHVFLTGKAGTGKTTFLKSLSSKTHKQLAIVAPTGIAALNAGGVTIHSQFLLPFGMFIPDRNLSDDFQSGTNSYTSNTLARKHPLNSVRKQVLRSIDLLVIDEVSMLRADLLDAIDYRMKAARGNFAQSFGGVQLLLIGDLYQLPPVVKRDEESVLRKYYESAWFFESKALQRDGFVYIELDKIFRQHDDVFIRLLNNLRNNQATREDINELNKHYKTPEEIQNLREVITLTTHNYKADDINMRSLQELATPSHMMHATIEGDFPDSMHPVLQHLELKEGAQIMFTKNDSEGKVYFNGKLATVKNIVGNEVEVEMAGTNILYTLKKEVWENKRYTLDSTSLEIDDEVIGTFEQYPVKLAWAITVHKSQGLTFDKAIIDVGQAFADGQVYVALSRLRSLDGLILRTHIQPGVISTDNQIVSFTERNSRPEELPVVIKTKQRDFILQLITRTFDFEILVKEIEYIRRSHDDSAFDDESMKPVPEQIKNALLSEKENTEKFRWQLHSLLESNSNDPLLQRIRKGSAYYKTFLLKQLAELLTHTEEMRRRKRVKSYVTSLTDLDTLLSKKLEEIDKVLYLIESIFEGQDQFDFTHLSRQRASQREDILQEIKNNLGASPVKVKKRKSRSPKKSKTDERSTYDVTFGYFQSGISVEAIAKERGLTVGTIESHLAKFVSEGRIQIFSFIPREDVELISNAIKDMPEGFTSKELFDKLERKFSYARLRAVLNHASMNLKR